MDALGRTWRLAIPKPGAVQGMEPMVMRDYERTVGRHYEAVEVVPAEQLRRAVEDRDKLAAYLRWRRNPQQGSAPMTLDEVESMLARLPGGQCAAPREEGHGD